MVTLNKISWGEYYGAGQIEGKNAFLKTVRGFFKKVKASVGKDQFLPVGMRSLAVCGLIASCLGGLSLFSAVPVFAAPATGNVTTYYHLDMGLQLVQYYKDKNAWENNMAWGDTFENLSASITFGREGTFSVKSVTPYSGANFDFSAPNTSFNLPAPLASSKYLYDKYYAPFSSNFLLVNNFSAEGNTVSFSYDALLTTPEPLEVYSFGRQGRDSEVYALFGGAQALRLSYPENYNAIHKALAKGASGTDNGNLLYLVFCPVVIEYTMTVEGTISGMVGHTAAWDSNRKNYNNHYFGEISNAPSNVAEYLAEALPRRRGSNVFWPGEKFVLEAAVTGNPTSVECCIQDTEYRISLSPDSVGTGTGDEEAIYRGELWNMTFLREWGSSGPERLTFVFEAQYAEGDPKTFSEDIIVDGLPMYHMTHRVR